MKRIAVILPGPMPQPAGGAKIVYEYARHLTKYGYQFHFYYPLNLPFFKKSVLSMIKTPVKLLVYKYLTRSWKWFRFEKSTGSIDHRVRRNLSNEDLKNYDLVLATAVETAYRINELRPNCPVLYFIQHFEDWRASRKDVLNSYRFKDFYNIVVSKWLKEIVEQADAGVFLYLPNPIDHEAFSMETPPERRFSKSVCMMHHRFPWKGSKEGLEALTLLRQKHQDLTASVFSVYRKPRGMPRWIKYRLRPSQRELRNLYNDHAIFLSSSYEEGFGLPPAEAMACGCCVVTTDSGGVLDFCVHDQTALVVKSSQPELLCKAMDAVIVDTPRRVDLAYAGNHYIKGFGWDRNARMLHEAIRNLT